MSSMEEAKKLMAERDALDRHIAEQEAVLKSHGVDMKTPLVDEEGYPVGNLDIHAVRIARKELICAQNDRKELTDELEKMIATIHEEARARKGSASACETNKVTEVHRTSNRPFAKVDNLFPDSPAQAAGLMSGDCILQFGNLHAENFKELRQLEPIVRDSEGNTIRVTVMREGKPLRLELTPQQWSGRGLLGCSIIPLTSAQVI